MFDGFLTLVYRAPMIVISTVIMASCSLLCMPFDGDGRLQMACARFWGKLLCVWLAGMTAR